MADLDIRKLSKAQVARVKKLFDECDEDRNNQIDIRELAIAMVKMGHELDAEQLEQLMDKLDRDQSGEIDFEEFLLGLGPYLLADELKDTDYVASESAAADDGATAYSAKDMATMKDIFDMCDVDNSGTVDKSELATLMRKLGHDLDDTQIDALFKQILPDGSNDIDFKTFVQALGPLLVKKEDKQEEEMPLFTDEQTAEMEEFFKRMDADSNGVLDRGELETLMKEIGKNFSPEKIKALLEKLDSNSNGVIELDEFKRGLGQMYLEARERRLQSTARTDERVRELKIEVAKEILSEEQLNSLKKAWKDYADEHTKLLRTDDLKNVLQAIGENPSRQEIRDLSKQLDVDNTGSIDYDEFIIKMAKRQQAIQGHGAMKSTGKGSGGNAKDSESDAPVTTFEEAMERNNALTRAIEDLRREVESLRANQGVLEEAGKKSNQKCVDLQEAKYELESEITDLRRDLALIPKLQKEKGDLIDDVAKTMEKNREKQTRIDELQKEMQELRKEKIESIASRKTLFDDLTKAKEEVAEIQRNMEVSITAQVATKRDELEVTSKKYVQEIRNQQVELERTQSEVLEWQKKYSELEGEFADFKVKAGRNRGGDNKSGGSGPQDTGDSLAGEFGAVGETVRDVQKEHISQLIESLNTTQADRDQQKRKNQELANSLKETQDKLKIEEVKVQKLTTETEKIPQLQKTNSELEARALADKERVDQMTRQVQEAEDSARKAEAASAARIKAAEEQQARQSETFNKLGEQQSAELDALRKELQKMQGNNNQQADQYMSQVSDLKISVAKLQKELEFAKGETEAANKEVKKAMKAKSVAEGERDKEKENAAEERANLQAAFETEKKGLNKQIAHAEQELANLTALHTKFGEDKAALKEKLADAEKLAQKEKARTDAEKAAIEEQLAATNAKVAEYKIQQATLEAQLEEANKKAQRSEESRLQLLTQMSSGAESSEAAASEYKATINKLETKLNEVNSDNERKTQALAEAEQSIESLRISVHKEKEKRRSEKELQEEARGAWEGEKGLLNEQIATLTAEATELHAKADKYKEKAKRYEAECVEKDETISKLADKIEREHKKRAAAVQEAMDTKAQLEAELKHATEEREELTAKLAREKEKRSSDKGKFQEVLDQTTAELSDKIAKYKEKYQKEKDEHAATKEKYEVQIGLLEKEKSNLKDEVQHTKEEQEAMMNEAKSRYATLESDLKVTKMDVDSYKEKLDKMTQERDRYKRELEALLAERAALEEKLASSQATAQAGDASRQALDAKMSALQAELQKANSDLVQMTAERAAEAAERKRLAQDLGAITAQRESEKAEFTGKIEQAAKDKADADAALQAANAKSRELATELDLKEQARAGLAKDLAAAQANLTSSTGEMGAKFSSLQAELGKANEDLARVTAEKQSAESERKRLAGEVGTLTAQADADKAAWSAKEAELNTNLAALKEKVANETAAHEKTKAKLEAISGEFDSARTQWESKKAELNREINTLETRRAGLQAELDSVRSASAASGSDLETRLTAANAKLTAITTERDDLRANLERERASRKGETDALTRDRDALRQDLMSRTTELETAKSSKQELESQLQREKQGRKEADERYERELSGLRDGNKNTNNKIEKLLTDLGTVTAERDAAIREKNDAVTKAASADKSNKDIIAQRDAKIVDLEKQLAEARKDAQQRSADGAAGTQRIKEIEEQLEAEKRAAAERQAKLEAANKTIADEKQEVVVELEKVKGQLAAEIQARKALEQLNPQLAQQLKDLQGRLDAEREASSKAKQDELDYELSVQEKSLVDFVNSALSTDADVAHLLPIGYRALNVTTATADGVLLCKLINYVAPGTIDIRVIKLRVSDEEDLNDNLQLSLNSAKAIGCSVLQVSSGDIRAGRVPVILQFMWEIVRIGLLSRVSPLRHPELLHIKAQGEDNKVLMRLPAEQWLLRWVNYHLRTGNSDKQISNFGADIKDSIVYTQLLHQLDAKCDLAPLQEGSLEARAEMVLVRAGSLQARKFVSPRDIVEGNPKLNMLFLANLFNEHSGLAATQEELASSSSMANMDNIDGTREQRVFKLWIASLGIEKIVDDLETDLRDGIAILQVLDKISPGCVTWRRVNTKKLTKFTMVENTNYVIEVAQSLKFHIVNVQGKDIADGNLKLTLGILWQAMRYHILSIIKNLSVGGREVTEEDVIAWANMRVANAGKTSTMRSFQDKSLADSIFLIDLLFALRSRAVDYSVVTPGATEEDKKLNAKYAISVARKIGAVVFLVHEDITEVNPKMLLTLVGALMSQAGGR